MSNDISPSIQPTPVNPLSIAAPGSWYSTETMSGVLTADEIAWMAAQGWVIRAKATFFEGTEDEYAIYDLQRRIIKPERVLQAFVSSYTAAYNEGRQLNDQRFDDIVALWQNALSKTQATYNELEADDVTYETLVEAIIGQIDTDQTAYAADVDGDLDTWGVDLLAEINARYDAELSKAQQSLVDRGLYSSTSWVTHSAGIERERTRALNNANDTIQQRQLELKHKVQAELISSRQRVLAARERLRAYVSDARARQVSARNAVAELIAGIVERRNDTYPALSDITNLAAGLGAGSAEAFSP